MNICDFRAARNTVRAVVLASTLALIVGGVGIAAPRRTGPFAAAASCVPAVSVTTSVVEKDRGEITALTVTLTANGFPGDTLAGVRFTRAANTAVEANGHMVTVPSSVTLGPSTASWSFTMRKVALDLPMQVDYVATDACGDVAKFSGAGTQGGKPVAASTPAPPTSTSVPPTATSVPPTATSATATVTPVPTSATAADCPVGQYLAEYYANRTFSGSPVVRRCEATIDNYWGVGAPAGVAVDGFSVRWTGQHAFQAGTYTFLARSDDGMRAWADGMSLIDAWRDQSATQYLVSRAMTEGVHTVKVEYYEGGGDAVATFRWQPSPVGPQPTPVAPVGRKQYGVSIAGGEFGSIPGTMNADYIYSADRGEYGYFAGKGLTLVRLPFRWERLQRAAFAPLYAQDVAGIRAVLDAAQATGQRVILDPHNYGRYYDAPLTRADAAKFADFWEKVALTFRGHPGLYGYELMNEPHDLPEGSDAWAYLAQVATDAIRRQDSSAWVLVPGYHWQSGHSWPQENPFLDVRDPSGKLLYAAHEYFDAHFGGTYEFGYDAPSPTVGVDRIRPFLDWLAARQARGIITEYGVPGNDPRWLTVLDNFMAAIDASPNIQGGTYWAAGPWWGTYPLSIEPNSGQDRPQTAVLAKYATRP